MMKTFAIFGAVALAAYLGGCSANPSQVGTHEGSGGAAGGAAGGGQGGTPLIDGGNFDAGTFEGDPKTCAHAASSKSYVGCDFWPTIHPNVVNSYFDFAVVVANAGDAAAQVTIKRDGKEVATGEVPPNGLKKFFLPWVPQLKHFMARCPADSTPDPGPLTSARVLGGAFHLTTSAPVTVYQFNPLEFVSKGGPPNKDWGTCAQCWVDQLQPALGGTVCGSYTNDASLLLPSTALTGDYVVSAQSGIDTSEIKSPAM